MSAGACGKICRARACAMARRENGKEAAHFSLAAFGAARGERLTITHEFFEARLAGFALILVNRHRILK